jgi:hypothetical protein
MAPTKLLFLVFFISIASAGVCQTGPAETSGEMLVTHLEINAKHARKWSKRITRQRLQLYYSASDKSLALKAHPLIRLNGLKVKFTLQSDSVKASVSRKEIAANIARFHSQLPATTTLGMDSAALAAANRQYEEDLRLYLAGKRPAKSVVGQWLTLAYWEQVNSPEGVSVSIRRPFKTIATLTIDTLPTIAFPALPTLSDVECLPIDRFFELKKLKGYGIDQIKYLPYTGHDQNIFKKRHGVFFPRNKIVPESASMDSLRQYLTDNDLSILKADFYGYSSFEGDSLLNRNLQEKRAAYLYQALNDMSSDPIEADTIGFADGYEALLSAARKNGIAWMTTLPKAQLRDTLQKDSALLASLEPLLKRSRKAELQLVLAKKLNQEERIDKAFRVFNQTAYRVVSTRSGQISNLEQQRLNGMLRYLFTLFINDEITSEQLSYTTEHAPNTSFVRILFAYLLIQQFERDRPIQLDSAFWYGKLAEFDRSRVFENANEAVISLLYSKSIASNAKPMLQAMAVDMQYYTFRYINNGTLHPSVLCRFSYPNTSGFYALKLNHYAFLQQLPPEKGNLISCYSGANTPYYLRPGRRRFTGDEIGSLAERLENEAGAFRRRFESETLQPPTYYNGTQSDYYYFLKVLFLEENEAIKKLVSQSDQLIEFDLYNFVHDQVQAFDPLENVWLEKEIPLEKISSLLRRLMRSPGRLCPVMLENISLGFHLKTLYYVSKYYDPTNVSQQTLARDALTYISSYYRKKRGVMTPYLEALIQRQINLFYWLPGTRNISDYRLY